MHFYWSAYLLVTAPFFTVLADVEPDTLGLLKDCLMAIQKGQALIITKLCSPQVWGQTVRGRQGGPLEPLQGRSRAKMQGVALQ